MDFTIEVGKFYRCKYGNKWECIAIHANVAFMAMDAKHHCMIFCRNKGFLGDGNTIIGQWIDPLAIKCGMVPDEYDRIEILSADCRKAMSNIRSEYITERWLDHIAPNWRYYIGETHYRDGRVEKAN